MLPLSRENKLLCRTRNPLVFRPVCVGRLCRWWCVLAGVFHEFDEGRSLGHAQTRLICLSITSAISNRPQTTTYALPDRANKQSAIMSLPDERSTRLLQAFVAPRVEAWLDSLPETPEPVPERVVIDMLPMKESLLIKLGWIVERMKQVLRLWQRHPISMAVRVIAPFAEVATRLWFWL